MISIGTDIVYIPRIHDLIDLKGTKFLNKVFTDDEIIYCNKNTNPSIHFSGKYAAKEAVKKALLGKEVVDFISLKDIEILNKLNKAPYVQINSKFSLKLNFDISISHDNDYAVSFVVMETL